ncbi:O-antigen polymerase [Bacillus sp. T3]|uniref:O-antigen polymerase n=1 Tax=Bacillus sp. T3 TaxID=467262 RepID=UPI00298119E3|nr:O-antigen polymerase [Bacillus sp. T3]
MFSVFDKRYSKLEFSCILGIIIYRILLDFVYFKGVTPIFGYSGFYTNFNLGKYITSWLILFIIIPFVISLYKATFISSIILITLTLLSYIPFTTMVAFHSYTIGFIISNIIYWLSIFICYVLFPNLKFKSVKSDKLTYLIINIILFLFLITVLYISFRYTGFRLTLDLFNVYDLRSEASSFNLPIIIGYIYSASKAINPVLLVYFLSKKNYTTTVIIFFVQLLSFSINGSKTVLFTTFLAVLLYWFYNNKLKYKLPWFLSIICLLGILELYIYKTYFIVAFFIRRVMFVPNLLHYYYYDFFSRNTPDYFRQSFLRHFGFETPYTPIDNLIGAVYFNKPDMGANNGLFSDAFANFGFIGLVLMPLIIVVTLKIFDGCTEGLNLKILIVSGITISIIFISSFYFTVLLTHGFIALCIMLYLLPRKTDLKIGLKTYS